MESFSNEELTNQLSKHFQKLSGKGVELKLLINTRWSNDHFSYGSYSYPRTGSSRKDYQALAQTISDRVFFAGEATCERYPATTHGAYLTGIREAEKIKNFCSK